MAAAQCWCQPSSLYHCHRVIERRYIVQGIRILFIHLQKLSSSHIYWVESWILNRAHNLFVQPTKWELENWIGNHFNDLPEFICTRKNFLSRFCTWCPSKWYFNGFEFLVEWIYQIVADVMESWNLSSFVVCFFFFRSQATTSWLCQCHWHTTILLNMRNHDVRIVLLFRKS